MRKNERCVDAYLANVGLVEDNNRSGIEDAAVLRALGGGTKALER